jgi:hypothetical protein
MEIVLDTKWNNMNKTWTLYRTNRTEDKRCAKIMAGKRRKKISATPKVKACKWTKWTALTPLTLEWTFLSVGHCFVCPLNYGFWLPLWYLLAIVLSILGTTAPDYLFDICWPLYCLSFELRLLITHLIYFGHCIVCPLYYGFWLPIWYTLAIVLSVLYITASYYPFDILWPLYCLSFELRLLITHFIYFGHCIACPLNYGFWLPIWYTLAIVLSVLWIEAVIQRTDNTMAKVYQMGNQKP